MRAALLALALAGPTSTAATPCALSNVLADHLVLQREPASAMVWGFAPPGTGVKTLLAGSSALTSIADPSGVWRQALPPQPASAAGTIINFTCTTGESFALNDVLFGEVAVCGGQSASRGPPHAQHAGRRAPLQHLLRGPIAGLRPANCVAPFKRPPRARRQHAVYAVVHWL